MARRALAGIEHYPRRPTDEHLHGSGILGFDEIVGEMCYPDQVGRLQVFQAGSPSHWPDGVILRKPESLSRLNE